MIGSVDVEQYWGNNTSLWQAIPLVHPFATLIVQHDIKSGQHILNDPADVTVRRSFIKLLNQDPMVYCVYVADMSTKAAPVTIPL